MFSKDSPSTYLAITSSNSQIEILSAVSPFTSIQSFSSSHGGPDPVYIDFLGTTLLTCGGTNNKIKTWDVTANPASPIFTATFNNPAACAFRSATQIGASSNNNL